MKKVEEFDNILNECLERLLLKGETVEQCLASYPEQAASLKPRLETALAIKQALAIEPRPEFRAKARYLLHLALQEKGLRRTLPLSGWQRQWATAVTVALILLLVGGGIVAAASYSMPDNPLYPVKLATEQARLVLTTSNIGKAELYAELADRRVAEIVYMANKGELEQMEKITRQLDNCLTVITSLVSAEREATKELALQPAPQPPTTEWKNESTYPQARSQVKLRATLERHAINHRIALQAALETAPESVKPTLLKAIAVSETGYETALNALDQPTK